MSLSKYFEDYCKGIQLTSDEREKWQKRLDSITKKLNKKYYDSNSTKDNMIVVGSVGRNTSVHGVSDWDCIFSLPKEIFKKFDSYESNGQSALLQEVKKEIKSLYPSTDIKGDGQVVVISFNDGDIELVPGFEQYDSNYKYPDSNAGGSWKITKPIPEQDEANKMSEKTDYHYIYLSQLLRKWKNNIGFKFKGLLIDTMVKKFIDEDDSRKSISFSDYSSLLIDLFEFLSKEDSEKSYWSALGSNQQISNDDNGKFIKKAKKAFNKLKDLDDEDKLTEAYRSLFGNNFAKEAVTDKKSAPYEEFAERKFAIDVQFNMKLDCKITQDGFRTRQLRDFLAKNWALKINKTLDFEVVSNDIPKNLLHKVQWFWKVRNVGNEAIKRNQERGQIFPAGTTRREVTSFNGNHYVECYAVVNNTVIARDRIKVPISTLIGRD